MEEKPNYYAIIPANVRYNVNLNSSQKLFYGEITTLTQKTGECWASNNYFSNLYNVRPSLISNWLRALEKENLIVVEYEKKGKEITKRIIRLVGTQNIEYVFNKSEEGIQNIEPNNTSINNTSKKEIYKERFVKPTLEEVKEYCLERNNNIDAQYFIDYYTKIGWVYGKNRIPIKDWKSCIRTWENNNKKTILEKEKPVPDWFDKQLEVESDLSDEDRRFIEEVERCD